MRFLVPCFYVLLIFLICQQKSYGLHLKIAWLVPDINTRPEANTKSSVGALQLALDVVNRNNKLLVESNIRLKHFPVDCEMTSIITKLLKIKRTFHPDVIVGPPCQAGMKTVGILATDWNLPVFTWYNMGSEFDNSTRYPTMIRLIPSVSALSKVVIKVVRQFNQTRFTAIYHKSSPWRLAHESLVAETRTSGLSVTSYQLDTVSSASISALLQNAKKTSTVLVLVCPRHIIRAVMLEAVKQGMANGRFTFIRLDPEIHSGNLLSDNGWKKGDSMDMNARMAYRFLIHIVFDPMYDNGHPTKQTPTNRFDDFATLVNGSMTANHTSWDLPTGGQPDVYSMFLYDAVLVWAAVTDRMLKLDEHHRNGRQFASIARHFQAQGATGYIALDENLDRHGKVFVLNMGTDGNFKPLQIHRSTISGTEFINLAPLVNNSGLKGLDMTTINQPHNKPGTLKNHGPKLSRNRKIIKIGTFTSFNSKTGEAKSPPIKRHPTVVQNLAPTTVLPITVLPTTVLPTTVETEAPSEAIQESPHPKVVPETNQGEIEGPGAVNNAETAENMPNNIEPYKNVSQTVSNTNKEMIITIKPITGEYNEPTEAINNEVEIVTSTPTVSTQVTTQSNSEVAKSVYKGTTFFRETTTSKQPAIVPKDEKPNITKSPLTTREPTLKTSTLAYKPTTEKKTIIRTRPTPSPKQRALQKLIRENYQSMVKNLREELGLPDYLMTPNEAMNDYMAEFKHLFETTVTTTQPSTTINPGPISIKTEGGQNRRTVIVIDSSKLAGAGRDSILKQIANLLKQSGGNSPIKSQSNIVTTEYIPTEEPWWMA